MYSSLKVPTERPERKSQSHAPAAGVAAEIRGRVAAVASALNDLDPGMLTGDEAAAIAELAATVATLLGATAFTTQEALSGEIDVSDAAANPRFNGDHRRRAVRSASARDGNTGP